MNAHVNIEHVPLVGRPLDVHDGLGRKEVVGHVENLAHYSRGNHSTGQQSSDAQNKCHHNQCGNSFFLLVRSATVRLHQCQYLGL